VISYPTGFIFCSNTRAFRSFHTTQISRMIDDHRPFALSVLECDSRLKKKKMITYPVMSLIINGRKRRAITQDQPESDRSYYHGTVDGPNNINDSFRVRRWQVPSSKRSWRQDEQYRHGRSAAQPPQNTNTNHHPAQLRTALAATAVGARRAAGTRPSRSSGGWSLLANSYLVHI
jgi:hypothetical protein